MKTAGSRAQLQVAAIEVDGILDELSQVVAHLSEARIEGIRALAQLELFRDRLINEGSPDWPVDHERGE